MEEELKPGVYRIRNTVNGKAYIGSAAKSIKRRWRQHFNGLRRGKHHSIYLQRAWDKYGEQAFVFEIIEACLPEDCMKNEQFWMDVEHVCERAFGYNLNPTACSRLGAKHRPEALAKMLGRKPTAETRAKMSASQLGAKQSVETRAKRSAALLGIKRSPETRAKVAEAIRGIKRSAETKAKISAANRGKKRSEETKAKRAAATLIRLGADHHKKARARATVTQRLRRAEDKLRFGNTRKACRAVAKDLWRAGLREAKVFASGRL